MLFLKLIYDENYTLLSVNGKVLKQGSFNIGDNNSINISNLPSGMYFLQVESNKGVSTKKNYKTIV